MEAQETRVREVARPGGVPDRHPQGLVCVAVDGSRAARQAVVWGAVEARLRHSPLLIVHVDVVATESLGAEPSRGVGADLAGVER